MLSLEANRHGFSPRFYLLPLWNLAVVTYSPQDSLTLLKNGYFFLKSNRVKSYMKLNHAYWDFLGHPVVKTLSFHCREYGSGI